MKRKYLQPELIDESISLIDVMTASGEEQQQNPVDDVNEDVNIGFGEF